MCQTEAAHGSAPLVSIIIPVYNGERFIKSALESVYRQSYRSFEVIIIDDGSEDDSISIIRSFSDPIRIYHQKNQGAAAARNKGISEAKGKYIAFLDADDLWCSRKLEFQVAYLEGNPHVGGVHAHWRELANDETPSEEDCSLSQGLGLRSDEDKSGLIYGDLLLDCVLHTSSVMFRSDIMYEVGGFDENLLKGQDYDCWIRISHITEIHKLQALLSFYRIHTSSITHRPTSINYGYEIVRSAINRYGYGGVDNGGITKRQGEQRLAQLAFDFAYLHYYQGDERIAHEYFYKAISHNPLWSNAWFFWLRSFF